MQISVLREQLCMKGALVELDDVSRERHDEILVVSQMSSKEREVCVPSFSALLWLSACNLQQILTEILCK